MAGRGNVRTLKTPQAARSVERSAQGPVYPQANRPVEGRLGKPSPSRYFQPENSHRHVLQGFVERWASSPSRRNQPSPCCSKTPHIPKFEPATRSSLRATRPPQLETRSPHPVPRKACFLTLHPAMAKTLFEKLWDRHVVKTLDDGSVLLYIDRHLVHEVTSPQAFEGLRMTGRKVRRPELTFATMDHNIPTDPDRLNIKDLRLPRVRHRHQRSRTRARHPDPAPSASENLQSRLPRHPATERHRQGHGAQTDWRHRHRRRHRPSDRILGRSHPPPVA